MAKRARHYPARPDQGHHRTLAALPYRRAAVASRRAPGEPAGSRRLWPAAGLDRRTRLPRDRHPWPDRALCAGRGCSRTRAGDGAACGFARTARSLWPGRAAAGRGQALGQDHRPLGGRALRSTHLGVGPHLMIANPAAILGVVALLAAVICAVVLVLLRPVLQRYALARPDARS